MSKPSLAKIKRRIYRKNKHTKTNYSIQEDFVWAQKGEPLSIRDWKERRFENSGFSSGQDLEIIVSKICQRASLSDLVFMSPMNLERNGNQKEICDLLVACKNTLICYQIKHRKINPDKGPEIVLSRANDLCIDASKQFRLICDLKEDGRTFLARNLAGYEVEIDLSQFQYLQLIAVVCFPGKNQFPRDTMFEMEAKVSEYREHPLHVFEADDFDKILREFDTSSDFLKFLETRSKFLKGHSAIPVRDLDIVASMKIHHDEVWKNLGENKELLFLEHGIWETYITKYRTAIERRAKLNSISYLFDQVLEHSRSALGFNIESGDFISEEVGKDISKNGDHFRVLLGFSQMKRLERRMFSESLLECIERGHTNSLTKNMPYAYRLHWDGVGKIGFLILAADELKVPRNRRRELLTSLCTTAAYRFSFESMYGIATEDSASNERSEDFFVLEGYDSGVEENDELIRHSKDIWKGAGRHSTTAEFQNF